LTRHNGKRAEKDFFLLNVLTVLDSVVPERSNLKWSTDPITGRSSWVQGPGPLRLALRHDVVSGHHLWREMQYSRIFFSNGMVREIEKAKLKGLVFDVMGEV
jgi:hypothetical protein